MVAPRRGEIWWAKQPRDPRQTADQRERRRPYLIVSGDAWNLEPTYPRVTVCGLTGAENVPRRYDTDVSLRRSDSGLPKDSIARCTELYTIFKESLVERAGRAPENRMREVESALELYLAFPTV